MPKLSGKPTRAEKKESNRRAMRAAQKEVQRRFPGSGSSRREWDHVPITEYTREIEDTLFAKIASGDTVVRACHSLYDETGIRINPHAVFGWISKHAEIRLRYLAAKASQADAWEDSLIHDAEEAQDGVNVQSQKLIIDVKRWIMGKNNIRFGDKLVVEGGENPIKTQNEHTGELTLKQKQDAYSDRVKKRK